MKNYTDKCMVILANGLFVGGGQKRVAEADSARIFRHPQAAQAYIEKYERMHLAFKKAKILPVKVVIMQTGSALTLGEDRKWYK
jgi:hypothetical protein